jgi:hypothetical protein
MGIQGMLTMRKGQAAVEYLTTYGWALLVLVILVAVLFSSGLLSPNIALSEGCQFGPNVPCSFALIDQGGTTGTTQISLRLFNGFAYKIRIISLELSTTDGSASFTWSANPPPFELESGDNKTLTGDLGVLLPAGSVQQFNGNITYESCAPEVAAEGSDCSAIQHLMTGAVSGKILAGS